MQGISAHLIFDYLLVTSGVSTGGTHEKCKVSMISVVQGGRHAPQRATLTMHSIPLSGGPQLPDSQMAGPQLLPNLPSQPQAPSFTPYHPVGPGHTPPMQLHFKHQAGIPIPHTNIPLQHYVDDVLHHRRGSDVVPGGNVTSRNPVVSQGHARPRDIAAVGRTALRLNP